MKNNSSIVPSKMDLPVASIIVPVFNGEQSISRCIESLLSQDYPKDKYEIIVVDNNSNDRTAKIIQKHPVKYVFEDRSQNSYSARNTGVRFSKGDALVFFDADQIATGSLLGTLLSEWNKEEYGAFGGKGINRVPGSPLIEKYLASPDNEEPRNGRFILLATDCAAYRRSVFLKLGGFDETFASGGDHDLCMRMQKILGLKIKFIFDAVFYHMQPRRNLSALMKKASRIGFSSCMLWSKYPELKISMWDYAGNSLSRTIMGFGSLLYLIIKPVSMKEKHERTILTLLDIFLKWAHNYGVLAYHLGMKRCGDLPPKTRSGKRQ